MLTVGKAYISEQLARIHYGYIEPIVEFLKEKFPEEFNVSENKWDEIFEKYVKPDIEKNPALSNYFLNSPDPAREIYRYGLAKATPELIKQQKQKERQKLVRKLTSEKGHKMIKGKPSGAKTVNYDELSEEEFARLPEDIRNKVLAGEI